MLLHRLWNFKPLLISLQYDKLGKLIKDFEPFKNMWLTASDWQKWYDSWMNDPLTTIDAEQLEQNVSNAFKTIFKCVKHFREIPACQEVAMEVKEKIENFKPYIPLIQGLRNPGMRSRHWEQVRVFSYCNLFLIFQSTLMPEQQLARLTGLFVFCKVSGVSGEVVRSRFFLLLAM